MIRVGNWTALIIILVMSCDCYQTISDHHHHRRKNASGAVRVEVLARARMVSAGGTAWVHLSSVRKLATAAGQAHHLFSRAGKWNYSSARGAIKGKTLIVAYETLPAYVQECRFHLHEPRAGFLGELWTDLEESMGFRSVFLVARDERGKELLRAGGADVFMRATVVTAEDIADLQYTLPVTSHWYNLFLKVGIPEVSGDSYIRALSSHMWAMTATTICLLAGVIWVTATFRKRLGMGTGLSSETGGQHDTVSIGTCFLTVLGGLCTQGWQNSPLSTSLRALGLTALFFGYLVYNAYSGVLVSYLAAGSRTTFFSSLEDFAEQGTHTLCVRNESYAYTNLKDKIEWRALLNKGPCLGLSRDEQVAAALCEDGMAVLEIPHVMASIMDTRPPCIKEIGRVRGKFCRGSVSLLLRRDFRYTDSLDYTILRARSAGILDRLEQKYFPRNLGDENSSPCQDGTSSPSFMEVSLEHVQAVLALYTAFQAVPLMLLGLECLAHRSNLLIKL